MPPSLQSEPGEVPDLADLVFLRDRMGVGKLPDDPSSRSGQMAASNLENRFQFLWRVAQGPPLEREFQFHPTRRWRADFAHLPTRTLIEIEGGIFMRKGGRHTRGTGYAKDAEKYLEAVMAGWTVLRLTERQLEVGIVERIAGWLSTLPGATGKSSSGLPR